MKSKDAFGAVIAALIVRRHMALVDPDGSLSFPRCPAKKLAPGKSRSRRRRVETVDQRERRLESNRLRRKLRLIAKEAA